MQKEPFTQKTLWHYGERATGTFILKSFSSLETWRIENWPRTLVEMRECILETVYRRGINLNTNLLVMFLDNKSIEPF